ncbi:MAG TPA: hypothetical protein PKY87_17520, partial [Terricaulis sp.]|nr:hypothetical protein [Terricaulis sp.]
ERGVRPPVFVIDTVIAMLDRIAGVRSTEQVYFTSLRRKLTALAEAETDAARREQIERANAQYLGRAEQIVRERIIPAHQRAAAFLRSERARVDAEEAPGVSRLP